MLFQPIRKNDDARYVPVVLVHDHDSDGAQMMARLRSVAWQRLNFNALLVCPTFTGAYAFLQNGSGYGPGSDQFLFDALAAQTEVQELTDRMLMFGFGDGAQYAHRLTMRHPRRIAGCVALSAGSWTDHNGFSSGPMVQDGSFDEPLFDTDAVRSVRKAACTEPTALPGVRWLVGASTDAPEHESAAEQFRNDLMRAQSPVEAITWSGDPERAGMPQLMSALTFFNDVVAQPAELPPAPPKPVATEEPTLAEAVEPADAPAKIVEPAETPATDLAAADLAATPSPEVPSEPGPDDSDAPLTHGRNEDATALDSDEPPLTARERAQLNPKPKAPAPKPGEGNGFFDQLLRQQGPSAGSDTSDD